MSGVLYTEERASQLGRFATELGGSLELYGDWVPGHSPEDAAAILLSVAGYLGAVQVPLEEAKEIAMADTRERFDTETSPDTEPWIGLSDSYHHYKVEVEGYPDMILERTGLLKTQAPHGWIVAGSTLVYDPHVLPKDDGFSYGALHQEGGHPSRELTVSPTYTFVPGEGFKETGKKTSKGLPARPFIGLSDEAVAKIAAAFSLWADGAIAGIGDVGGAIPVGSNILGEFPVMGYHGIQPILRTPRGPRFGRIPGF